MNIFPEWTGTTHKSVYPTWLGAVGQAVKKFSLYAHYTIFYKLK
jgi:hypothetical protein